MAEELTWWAATAEQVLQAPCKTQHPPSRQEMLQSLKFPRASLLTTTVHGVAFKNEAQPLIQLFADLHALDISWRGRPALKFSVKCDKVVCAMKEIYGDDEGVQLLYLLKTFGFNGSHLRTANASAWRPDELNEILQALHDYPLSLYPITYNKRLIHFARGKRYSFGEEIVANASMEVFDLWNELSFPERQQTFLHELGHTLAYRGQLDTSTAWLKIGGWKESRKLVNKLEYKVYELADPSKAVSEYGMLNPQEDFAESVVAYRFRGAYLKKAQPEKYEFLKTQTFANREYLSEDQCLK
ncbi:hypothetical protein QJS83_05410 [Bdellovibrio sp. 22V]|uniref:hypothetical protein n=1 Tax=Bdellovibrio sp. 22V TaxID=3044166 RepID=UPI0025437C40|nr:hypothetical protein [Bdellovibrio sp. 22V]WII73306.1 hypothetical protein QJS83_05410 [Bdellovibrio sp. 22V]